MFTDLQGHKKAGWDSSCIQYWQVEQERTNR